MEPRPYTVEEEHLVYLDELRERGDTNMYGATPYLQEQFGLSRAEGRQVLTYWMSTFDERHPRE